MARQCNESPYVLSCAVRYDLHRPRMRLTGYGIEDRDADEFRHIELAEISLLATPVELRRIAAFLSDAADNMDRMGGDYDHEHLGDRQPGFDDSPHLVVARAR
ncbi:Imm32 family immunity protein [Lysobacter sp. 1R34A]|uniref:Imm32 family immunity protein n=1 Tax=Lysobacter sp. 1R34A TaxID=3445786 RepID=UPI003EEAF424